jgi:hypothetical protein
MSSRLEKLFDLLQLLEVKADLKRINKKWVDLPAELKKLLDDTMNGGIPREEVKYELSVVNGIELCLAEYKDAKTNFTASYLVYGDDVLYVNES